MSIKRPAKDQPESFEFNDSSLEEDLSNAYHESDESFNENGEEIYLHAENSNLDLMDSYEGSQQQQVIVDQNKESDDTQSEVLSKLLEDADEIDQRRRRFRIQTVDEGEHRYYKVKFNLYGGY